MIDIDVSKIVSEIGEPSAHLIENEEEKRKRVMTLIFSFIFLFILLASTITFVVLNRIVSVSAQKLSVEAQKLKEENKQYLSVENESKILLGRNQDTLAVILNNPVWSYVLEKLEAVVPFGVTYSRFDMESPEKMRLAGISSDYTTLSKLVVSMSNYMGEDKSGQKDKVFDNVAISSASLIKLENNRQVVDFTISFSFVKKINYGSINPLEEIPIISPEVKEETPAAPSPELPNIEAPTPETPTPPPAPETPTPETPATPEESGGLPVL